MSILVFLFANLLLNFSVAEDIPSIACDSLDSLKNTQSLETMNTLREARSEIQNFLKTSNRFIKQKIKSQNYEDVAITCGLIDEVTQGFTKSCVDDANKVIDLQFAEETCKDYLNK